MKELSSNTTPHEKTNYTDKCGQQANKMATAPVTGMFIKMGLPMIISMVLQALYNVIDSIFVANMKADGALANQALSIAFPVQILMIAIGVGTGVGINACLSKSLGESEKLKADKIAGNGIFLSFVIYAVFLIFGLFFAKPFVKLFTKNGRVIKMGTDYLAICCTLSLGSIGYTVYERFLQATGKTLFSTIAQILGAVTNIILDYVFIFPLNGGVEGAAWATVAGQFVSLFVAMAFHYLTNKEINGNVKNIKPEGKIIREIYKIGISAAIMQALLSVMTAGMNAIFDLAGENSDILIGTFGIYYKIQQIALFSAFGLSNTIITVLSFNYGLKDKQRIISCIKTGLICSLVLTAVLTVVFEIAAKPLSGVFALSGGSTKELIPICEKAVRTGSTGFIFMGFTVVVQGILQAFGYSVKPLILSALRLAIFVFPTAILFTLSKNTVNIVWWTFPIAEVLTAIFSVIFLIDAINKKVKQL
ncbi:MAG: MATE family efflux transporter [Clostridia bacterium]|nr:MATE family efflux transporter [Clostridia bacterium]